ncbi:sentrin-specific protease 7 isoform 2-T2 [Thomomys bottae]
MDKRKLGRRRSSPEVVTEGKRRKSSSDLYEWKRSLRNKVICIEHKNKKGVRGRPVTSKPSSERHLKVMLTNVLWTDLGRKFRKTLPRNDANLWDAKKVQSDSLPSTSVDSIETCQKLESLHQSLNLSERASQQNKTINNVSAVCAKEKRRDDDDISRITSDTQTKDGSRNKDVKHCDSSMEPVLISKKIKRRVINNVPGSHNSTSLDKSTEHPKEQENVTTVSTEFEQPSENSYQNTTLFEKITSESTENDSVKLFSLGSQQLRLSTASTSATSCSATNNLGSAISTDEVEITSPSKKSEDELNVVENCLLSEHSEENQSLISAEPIVVSSDEEGPIEHKSSGNLKFQTNQGHEIVNENQSISKSSSSELPVVTCESVKESPEFCSYNSITEKSSCTIPNNETDLHLDFIFTSVYIGKMKGTSKGCITFTTKYVKIPFQVSLNEVSLVVDTKHLKRFGLWKSKDEDYNKRSHAILFLWVSSRYLQEIQTQLENSLLSQQSKSSEFIFLELNNAISQREELKLKDIMMEISTTNGELELSYPLSWVQAFPLFQNLSSKESSFIHYYCDSACLSTTAAAEEMKMKPLSQPSNTDAAKPTYTFLQKQSSGCYSLSITSNPDEEWREVRHTGPVQKLIVYPPPPTKGGLGVTNEDLECLEEGEFLNDVIIDFYLKYLMLEKASDELVERSHIFSSFFYKCLTRKENNLTEDNPDLSIAQRRHRRVRTWTRHINIFNKDYIFVPVNESSHWYLAVICFPWLEEVVYEDFPQSISQQFQAPQSQHDNRTTDNDLHTTSTSAEDSKTSEMSMTIPKKLCKRPCILILDSLKAASIQNTVQNLREYLEVEWEVKRKTHREFSKTNMVDLCPKVPKQDNSSDCGVYLLQYVESFFKDPIVNFELPIHLEKWFPRHVIKTKREDIRELILKLHLQQQKGSNS